MLSLKCHVSFQPVNLLSCQGKVNQQLQNTIKGLTNSVNLLDRLIIGFELIA